MFSCQSWTPLPNGAYSLGQAGILGVVDDDYDVLCDVASATPHVVHTDAPDLEVIMIRTAALERLLQEAGEPTRIAMFEAQHGLSTRDALLARAALFGRLRLLSRQNQWNVISMISVPGALRTSMLGLSTKRPSFHW
jgi:hypothetical protein